MSDSNPKSIEQRRPLPKSRTNRILIICLCLLLLLAFPFYYAVRKVIAMQRQVTVVASFRDDFRPETPAPGWGYYWNKSGPVGDTNNYLPLVWSDDHYSPTNSPLPAPSPARYMRLSGRSGHPGSGSSQTSKANGDECAVIVAFTVPEGGRYVIKDSLISRHDGALNGSVHLQVFVNERSTLGEIYCRSRDGNPFDRELGVLTAGDSIYVCISAGETDKNDSFGLNFSIGRF